MITISLSYLIKQKGNKFLMGNNFSSDPSIEAVRTYKENYARFIFLSVNSSHHAQPLDVKFLRPLKTALRKNEKVRRKFRKTSQIIISPHC